MALAYAPRRRALPLDFGGEQRVQGADFGGEQRVQGDARPLVGAVSFDPPKDRGVRRVRRVVACARVPHQTFLLVPRRVVDRTLRGRASLDAIGVVTSQFGGGLGPATVQPKCKGGLCAHTMEAEAEGATELSDRQREVERPVEVWW